GLAALRAVRELDALAGAEEVHRVVPDGVAAAHGEHADLRVRSLSDEALAPVRGPVREQRAAALGGGGGERERGPGRRVLLAAVVDLRHLDVERRAEAARQIPRGLEQDRDA